MMIIIILIILLLIAISLCYFFNNILTYLVLILILVKLILKLTNGKCKSKRQLEEKVVIITGANSGIGKETAIDIASRGAKVILACRNLELGQQTKDEIIKLTNNHNIHLERLDFECLDSVREFCERIYSNEKRLDILINNAGAGGLGDKFTKDGLHIGMQVNHFGPFLLTYLLIDLLKRSAPSRIVTVASDAHFFTSMSFKKLTNDPDYLNKNHQLLGIDFINYSNSKFCNIMMSNELAKLLKDIGVTSNSLHPGAVSTNLFQHMRWYFRFPTKLLSLTFLKTPKEGAQTTIYLAVSEEVENISGKYFVDCRARSYLWKNEKMEKLVWELTENYLKNQIEKFKNNKMKV